MSLPIPIPNGGDYCFIFEAVIHAPVARPERMKIM
jgi:hypothetical protein